VFLHKLWTSFCFLLIFYLVPNTSNKWLFQFTAIERQYKCSRTLQRTKMSTNYLPRKMSLNIFRKGLKSTVTSNSLVKTLLPLTPSSFTTSISC
jgi:DNA repair exonuclease SbcCD ATPase subunit